MAALLIIAHAPLASALKAVAMHAFPECAPSVLTLDVDAGATLESVEASASALLADTEQAEILVFTDVFGATPCNVAQRLSTSAKRVKVVTGVNVPMLWRTLCYRAEPLDQLVMRAVDGASQGVMQVSTTPPQNQAAPSVAHDQDQARHQQ